jgi:hypothetical protein
MRESIQRRAEPALSPLNSAAGDVRRLRGSSAASVQELKDFLRQHRGKSSQELLGELGKTNLFQAMVKSTIGCVLLLAVLTVVPYLLQGKPQPKPAAARNDPPAAAAPAVAAPNAAAAKSDASAAPDGVDLEKAQKAMGLNETKAAPADVNPREKDLDNLLDGVK